MTEPGEKLRLFFAVRLPEPHLAHIERELRPQLSSFRGARWAPLENQHITLKFLGSTPAEKLRDIVAAGESAARVRPAEIGLTTLGAFPGRTRARVLWVGIDDPESVLSGLAAGLDDALRPLGFEPEARAFHPHLTLARFRAPVRLPDELPHPAGGLEPFPVEELVLFRSRLHPKGARYEALEALPLSGNP